MTSCRKFLPPDLPAEHVRCCIGLIADTHTPERCDAIPPAVFTALEGVDLLLHAGDVGELWVLDQLSAIAPVIAVHGNDDTPDAQRELPYQQVVAVAGQRLLLWHSHYPDRAEDLASRREDRWAPKLDRIAAAGYSAGASIVVYGHLHIPMAQWHNGVLIVNPGAIAAGTAIARQRLQTVALLFIRDDGAPHVVHVDLIDPEHVVVPEVDWAAGVRAALDTVQSSILSSRLQAEWEHLLPIVQALAPEQRRSLLLDIARPCWNGHKECISHADLLAALRDNAAIPHDIRARLESRLVLGDA